MRRDGSRPHRFFFWPWLPRWVRLVVGLLLVLMLAAPAQTAPAPPSSADDGPLVIPLEAPPYVAVDGSEIRVIRCEYMRVLHDGLWDTGHEVLDGYMTIAGSGHCAIRSRPPVGG